MFSLFVIAPSIAIAIGYAARKGKPVKLNRELFGMAFFASLAASGVLVVYVVKMQADVRTWQYLLQLVCFELGTLLFGIAGGCLIGMFTYRPSR